MEGTTIMDAGPGSGRPWCRGCIVPGESSVLQAIPGMVGSDGVWYIVHGASCMVQRA